MAASGGALKKRKPVDPGVEAEKVVEQIGDMRRDWMQRGGSQGSFSDFVPRDDFSNSHFSASNQKLSAQIAELPAANQAAFQTALQEHSARMKSHHDNMIQGVGFDPTKFNQDNTTFKEQIKTATAAATPGADDKQKKALDAFNEEMNLQSTQVFASEMKRLQATLAHQQEQQRNEVAYRTTWEAQYGAELAAERQFVKLTGQNPSDTPEQQKQNQSVEEKAANQGALNISGNDFSGGKGGYGVYDAPKTDYHINYQSDGKGGSNITAHIKTPQKSTWQMFKDVMKDSAVVAGVTLLAPIALPALMVAAHYGFKMGPAAEKQYNFKDAFRLQMDFLAQKTNSTNVQLDYSPDNFSKYHVENMFTALKEAKARAGYDPSKTPPISDPTNAMTFNISQRLQETFVKSTKNNMLTGEAVKMVKELGFAKDDYKNAFLKELEKFNKAVMQSRLVADTPESRADFQKAVGGGGPDDGKPKFTVQVEGDGTEPKPTKGGYTVAVETNEDLANREQYGSEQQDAANLRSGSREDADSRPNAEARETEASAPPALGGLRVGSAEDPDSRPEPSAPPLDVDDVQLREGDEEDVDSGPLPDNEDQERPRGPGM